MFFIVKTLKTKTLNENNLQSHWLDVNTNMCCCAMHTVVQLEKMDREESQSQRIKTLERFKELFPHKINDPIEWHHFKMYYELGIKDSLLEQQKPAKGRLIPVDDYLKEATGKASMETIGKKIAEENHNKQKPVLSDEMIDKQSRSFSYDRSEQINFAIGMKWAREYLTKNDIR